MRATVGVPLLALLWLGTAAGAGGAAAAPATSAGEIEDRVRSAPPASRGDTHTWIPGSPSNSVPADLDADGLPDRIYVATAAGLLYRFDPGEGQPGARLLFDGRRRGASDLARGGHGPNPGRRGTEARPAGGGREAAGEARQTAGSAGNEQEIAGAGMPGPIVLWIEARRAPAVVFQTGDALHVLLDDFAGEANGPPLTAASLAEVRLDAANVPADYLGAPPARQHGWRLALDSGERLLGEPLALGGALFFSTRVPDGTTRIYALDAKNGNALARDGDGKPLRRQPVPGLAGPPHAAPPGGGTRDHLEGGPPLLGPEEEFLEELLKLLPGSCRFAGYRIAVRVTTVGGGSALVAPVPVCLVEQSWKEL